MPFLHFGYCTEIAYSDVAVENWEPVNNNNNCDLLKIQEAQPSSSVVDVR